MDRPSLDPAALHAALDARWARIEVVDETDSTNADLLSDTSTPDRTLLVAESQVAGRGRLDRSWVAPPRAGLTFSMGLRPPVEMSAWAWLPLLAGVSLCDAVASATGVPVGLKWPNDLLQRPEEGKLAGILAQTAGDLVVIGIGLNVSTARDELPVPAASSLALAGAADVDRTALLITIAKEVDHWVEHWVDAGGNAEQAGIAAAYTQRCITLGRSVEVSLTDGRRVAGEAIGIDAHGRLEVLSGSGIEVVGAGDVEHLRAAD